MQLAKFIVLLWQGGEQAVTFPGNLQHAAVLNYIQQQSPGAKAVSAGFFLEEPGLFWHGGMSETLGIASRPQDGSLIQAMLCSKERRLWDLRVLVWEACEAARRRSSQIEREHAIAMSM